MCSNQIWTPGRDFVSPVEGGQICFESNAYPWEDFGFFWLYSLRWSG